MDIQIRIVNNKKLLRTFIELPAAIHKEHSNWLPPIYVDEWNYYNTRKNKAFNYCDTVLAIAYQHACGLRLRRFKAALLTVTIRKK